MPSTSGDLHVGDTVWLTPRTPGAPAICWKQAKATVRKLGTPYLVVGVDGVDYQVHTDNVRRTDPHRQARRPVKARTVKVPEPRGGVEDIPLW